MRLKAFFPPATFLLSAFFPCARMLGCCMQLVIELPPREEQLAFNRRRWEEICADPELVKWPGRVESDRYGNVIMIPPASLDHSYRTHKIQSELMRLLGGLALPECPVSTLDGVRAADVGWYTEGRFAKVEGQLASELAPEICVEVMSPRNRAAEMIEKKQLYFEAGAEEVWFCGEDKRLSFYHRDQPDAVLPLSRRCPGFPVVLT